LDLKELIIFEVAVVFASIFFIFDLLPKNYSDFNNICSEAWQNDPKQFEICMLPYHKQSSLSKNVITGLAFMFSAAPIYYFYKKNRK